MLRLPPLLLVKSCEEDGLDLPSGFLNGRLYWLSLKPTAAVPMCSIEAAPLLMHILIQWKASN